MLFIPVLHINFLKLQFKDEKNGTYKPNKTCLYKVCLKQYIYFVFPLSDLL